jgi:glycosyltransferase involved in cell wall biosynthesis
LYAGEENDAECTEFVTVVTKKDQEEWFAEYDFGIDVFGRPGAWDWNADWWRTMNHRAAQRIKQRAQPGDLLCLISGLAQKQINDEVGPTMRAVEWGIGYSGVYADFRAYESNAWRHFVQGLRNEANGRYFDRVIPNFFDPAEFHTDTKEDYILYMGRLNSSKGPHIAGEVADRLGIRLLIAGQGDPGLAPNAEHIGVVVGAERAKVLARARAVLVPSLYLEPFGGVAVEAMLSGTPAITSDWGAFYETVLEGQTGFRCNMLGDFCRGVERAGELEPDTVRALTMSRYSLDAVAPQFERWFNDIGSLDRQGWYSA